jgi:hypothetical protein
VEEHDDVPVALFEPPNPMVKPMYCKHLVYQVFGKMASDQKSQCVTENTWREDVAQKQNGLLVLLS